MKVIFIVGLVASLTLQAQSRYLQVPGNIPIPNDTLRVGYTYWWMSFGPFTPVAQPERVFVCVGTVLSNDTTSMDHDLATHSNTWLRIDSVLESRSSNWPIGSSNPKRRLRSTALPEVQAGDELLLIIYYYDGSPAMPSHSYVKLNQNKEELLELHARFREKGRQALETDQKRWRALGYEIWVREFLGE